MRAQGLAGQQNARFKVVTTDSNHDLPIAPNRLKKAVATRPNQIWVGDITYIKPPRAGFTSPRSWTSIAVGSSAGA